MYETYYGFTEKPFNLTPDPKYLYLSARHTEAFAHLEFGRRERGGFIVITGEVGTGKTTLARYFLARLDSRTASAFVIYPALSGAELLRSIIEDFHIPVTGETLKDHVDALHRFLLQARAEGREVVVLIDEAQDLSAEVLEQVRLISNLETDTEKLIQIVLMGQSELQEMLSRRELRQLAQRVTARYHLSPLTAQETADYIGHRLAVAGGGGKVSFTASAVNAVQRLSGGVPRLVNLICDRALLAGYVAGSRVIDGAMVKRAAREVGPPRATAPRSWLFAAAAAVLALAAVAWSAGSSREGSRTEAARPGPAAIQAAAAAPTAAPAPAAAPAAPSTSGLETVILGLSRDASYQGAVDQIQALWGTDAVLERTALRTHLDQLRKLDLPVVLEMFHPARRDTCSLALLRLEGNDAVVSAGAATGPLRVPLSELDRFWTRQAQFLWKDHEAMGTETDPARVEAWARTQLSRLGYAEPELGSAVVHFQRDAQLASDGVIGTRTLMTLYSLAPYARPHLGHGGRS